jgi:hypothetical protein
MDETEGAGDDVVAIVDPKAEDESDPPETYPELRPYPLPERGSPLLPVLVDDPPVKLGLT